MPRLEWLLEMSEKEFRETFRKSAVKRTKWAGLVTECVYRDGECTLRA